MKNNIFSPANPYVRFLNASDTDCIDFYRFNTLEFSKIKSSTFTNFIKASHGINTFKICPCGKKTVFASGFADLSPEKAYTVCALGEEHNLSVYTFCEPQKPYNLDYAYVSFSVLFCCGETHDYYANDKCIVSSIAQMEQSRYVGFVPGTYDFEVKKNDRKTVVGIKPGCSLSAGKYYSLVITSKKDEKGLHCLYLTENNI